MDTFFWWVTVIATLVTVYFTVKLILFFTVPTKCYVEGVGWITTYWDGRQQIELDRDPPLST